MKHNSNPYALIANRYDLDKYTFGWERPKREKIKLSLKEEEVVNGVSDLELYLTCFERTFLDGIKAYYDNNNYVTPKQKEKLKKIIELPNRKESTNQWFRTLEDNPEMIEEYKTCLRQMMRFKNSLCFLPSREKTKPTEKARTDISSVRFYDSLNVLLYRYKSTVSTRKALPFKKEYEWIVNNHYAIKSWRKELQRPPAFKEGQLVTLRRSFFNHGTRRIRMSSNDTLWVSHSSNEDYKDLIVFCWHREYKTLYNLKISKNTNQSISEAAEIHKDYKQRLKRIEEKMVFRIVKPHDDSVCLNHYAKGAKMVQLIPLCRNALCDEIRLVNVEERYLKPIRTKVGSSG
jgi:hypothetical protein